MRSDIRALGLADFAALGNSEEQAVYLLQSLLLDEQACRLRIAWLREMSRQARACFPDRVPAARPRFLEQVLAAVDELGIIAAWRQGKVTFAELEGLTRAPRALYEAHCLVLQRQPEQWPADEGDLITETEALKPGPVDENASATGPAQPTGMTSMSALLGAAEYERFRQRLERYPLLPELLSALELNAGLAGAFLSFIQEQCRAWQHGADLIDTMIHWLEAFAVAQHARPEMRIARSRFASIVRRVVARRHLDEAQGEEAFQTAFRQAALTCLETDYGSAHELMQALKGVTVSLTPDAEEDYRAYRKECLGRIQGALLLAEKIWRLAS
jgi:hypothetical protein